MRIDLEIQTESWLDTRLTLDFSTLVEEGEITLLNAEGDEVGRLLQYDHEFLFLTKDSMGAPEHRAVAEILDETQRRYYAEDWGSKIQAYFEEKNNAKHS